MRDKSPHTLEHLCKTLDIEIIYEKYSNDTIGYYNKFYTSQYIVVNSTLPKSKQTFVIAHEIGHSILHLKEKSISILKCVHPSIETYEKEADIFAHELLKYFKI